LPTAYHGQIEKRKAKSRLLLYGEKKEKEKKKKRIEDRPSAPSTPLPAAKSFHLTDGVQAWELLTTSFREQILCRADSLHVAWFFSWEYNLSPKCVVKPFVS
jgi:hypothetical protein